MKAKEIAVLEKCIENGILYGWNRAHKHTDEPSEDLITYVMRDAIMHEVYEWFEFDENEVQDK